MTSTEVSGGVQRCIDLGREPAAEVPTPPLVLLCHKMGHLGVAT